ncbi:MAG: tetratricopeptide repeat protein [Cyanothece sp. SIO1E1]|nr:tetratricopeptide repeat protein [Cyanothece sp. SIO1E1]
MQHSSKSSSTHNNLDLLDILELLSVVGSAGGSVAALVYQQAVFATIPLSLAAGLNLVNRRRLLAAAKHMHQVDICELTQTSQALERQHQADVAALEQQHQAGITKLAEVNAQAEMALKQQTQKQFADLDSRLNIIAHKLQIVDLEGCNQAIRLDNNNAGAYYRRGVIRHELGKSSEAVQDYTQALSVDPKHADAYYQRGLLNSRLGAQREAIEDLKKAAKFFFDQGKVAAYQKAQHLYKETLAQVDAPSEIAKSKVDESKLVTVENLFSADAS